MKYPIEQILSMSMKLGEHMLRSGAEVSRVEDTISRVCTAYGCDSTDVFSITSMVVASATHDGSTVTQSKRIYSYAYNMKQLEDLNALSRNICRNTPEPTTVNEMIDSIIQNDSLKRVKKLFGYLIAAFAFTFFFGGSFVDAIVATITAVLLFGVDYVLNRGKINLLFYSLIASIIAGFADVFFFKIGFGQHLDKIVIGNVMLLIPGVGLTNGLRDLLCGDIVSGLLRLCESVLIAVCVAVGFALPILITGGF